MKQIAALLIAVCLVLSLVACGKTPPSSSEGKVASSAPTQHPSQLQNETDGLLEDHTLAAIAERGTLVVAVVAENVPYCFAGREGELRGMDVSLAQALASEMGVEMELQLVSAEELPHAVRSGKADLALGGVHVTPEMLEEIDASVFYAGGGYSMVVRVEDVKRYNRVADFAYRVVAAPVGDAAIFEMMKELMPETEVKDVKSVASGVQRLRAGGCVGVVMDTFRAQAYAQDADLKLCKVALSSETVSPLGANAMVMKGNEALLRWLDTSLAARAKNSSLGNLMIAAWDRADLTGLVK